jgi:AraC family transcriptional regulator
MYESESSRARIQSRADRLQPLPPPVSRVHVTRRIWSGVCVDVTECWGRGEACANLGYESETRLWALLEENGGAHSEARFTEEQACPVSYTPRNMHFAPSGMKAWGYCANLSYLRDATIVFDVSKLEARWSQRLNAAPLSVPRWRFSDDTLWTLIGLLAKTVDDADPSSELFGDGLIVAILARLLRDQGPPANKEHGLARWQLRRVLDYLDAHLPDAVPLAALAGLARLSQAHFARAFKASTGFAPYQWQLRARVDRARALLLHTDKSLDEIAVASGFADAVHFGRTFRKVTGISPAAWRRSQKS